MEKMTIKGDALVKYMFTNSFIIEVKYLHFLGNLKVKNYDLLN
jgi:hypothetical protein